MASVFHISDDDAARDFKALVARVRAGEEVVVEEAGRPVLVMRKVQETLSASPGHTSLGQQNLGQQNLVQRSLGQQSFERRSIDEARAMLKPRQGEQGLATGDPQHATEMEAVHAIYNEPMDLSKWE